VEAEQKKLGNVGRRKRRSRETKGVKGKEKSHQSTTGVPGASEHTKSVPPATEVCKRGSPNSIARKKENIPKMGQFCKKNFAARSTLRERQALGQVLATRRFAYFKKLAGKRPKRIPKKQKSQKRVPGLRGAQYLD